MRREFRVELVKAFTDGGLGGNPAGVVIHDGSGLDAAQRQTLAGMVGVSETAFVLPSASADLKLEFFTPTRPIAHCGHATVAAFARLAQLGLIAGPEAVNETVDGPRRIRVDEQGRTFLEQVQAQLDALEEDDVAAILASLRISEAALLPGAGPFRAHNGNGSILIGVRSHDILSSLQPDLDAIREITNRLGAICYYVFALEGVLPGRDATARMFGPAYGIPEEAATGMAAGPLACWLDRKRGKDVYLIEQGHFMSPPSPSLIIAKPERADGRLSGIWVGGAAHLVQELQLSLE